MFPGRKGRRWVHMRSPSPSRSVTGRSVASSASRSEGRLSTETPTGTRRFNPYIPSERRRIVAQVRRKVLKNRDLLAVQDSRGRCDDLLTTGVDNADRAGL